MMKSSNPALGKDIFTNLARTTDDRMTVQGTVNRLGVLFVFLLVSFGYSWSTVMDNVRAGIPIPMHYIWIGLLGGLIVAIITIFVKHLAMYTAPVYALLEGLFLGAISGIMELKFPGIASQAAMCTLAVLVTMLFLYKSKIIKVTENFKMGVAAATGGICLIYMVSWILGMFGVAIPMIHEGGIVGIGFSLVVIAVASLNLVMDFDFIEHGEAAGAPKYMEWYGAFGLLVTLVWLYIEILRLLSKLRER